MLSDEFAIVGYTSPKGTRAGFGSLLLAAAEAYVGRVGSGFSHAQLGELAAQFERLTTLEVPVRADSIDPPPRGAHWVVPQIVAEVYYRGIGNLGLLRQPSLKAVRADKTAADLRKERSGQMRRKEAKCLSASGKPKHATRLPHVRSRRGDRRPRRSD